MPQCRGAGAAVWQAREEDAPSASPSATQSSELHCFSCDLHMREHIFNAWAGGGTIAFLHDLQQDSGSVFTLSHVNSSEIQQKKWIQSQEL